MLVVVLDEMVVTFSCRGLQHDGLTVRCVHIGAAPIFDPVREELPRFGRFRRDQQFECGQNRVIIPTRLARLIPLCALPDLSTQGNRPFGRGKHAAFHQDVRQAQHFGMPRFGEGRGARLLWR